MLLCGLLFKYSLCVTFFVFLIANINVLDNNGKNLESFKQIESHLRKYNYSSGGTMSLFEDDTAWCVGFILSHLS